MPSTPDEDTLLDDRSADEADTDLEDEAPEQEGDEAEETESEEEADEAESEDEEDAEAESDDDEALTADSEDVDTKPEVEQEDPATLRAELEELKRRFAGLKPKHDEMAHKLRQVEQYGDVPLDDAVQAWKQRQQAARTDVWDPQHPEYQKFQGTLSKFDMYQNMRNKAEDPAVVDKLWEKQFDDTEAQYLDRWNAHQRDFQRRMASNPAATIDTLVSQRVAQELEKRLAFDKANTHYQQWYAREDVAPVVAEHREAFGNMLQRGMLPEEALDILNSRTTAASAASAAAQASQAAGRHRERERLARGKASTSARSPKPSTHYDGLMEAKKYAKERGMPTQGPMWNQLLLEFSRRQEDAESDE